jgi:hypothetical protein
MLSEEEKKQLLGELDEIVDANEAVNKKVVELSAQQEQIDAEFNDIIDGI